MSQNPKKVALVTGSNRGIGFEIAKQLAALGIKVIASARSRGAGLGSVSKLAQEGLDVHFSRLDVSDFSSHREIVSEIENRFGRLDILVNNAGILLDEAYTSVEVPMELMLETFQTNALGALSLSQQVIPGMKKRGYGRIVMVSSGEGQLSSMTRGHLAYRVSKTALNAVTRVLAAETSGSGILINTMCPGWVRTDMGGPNAHKNVAEGADTAVHLATLSEDGPTGLFFRDGKVIPW